MVAVLADGAGVAEQQVVVEEALRTLGEVPHEGRPADRALAVHAVAGRVPAHRPLDAERHAVGRGEDRAEGRGRQARARSRHRMVAREKGATVSVRARLAPSARWKTAVTGAGRAVGLARANSVVKNVPGGALGKRVGHRDLGGETAQRHAAGHGPDSTCSAGGQADRVQLWIRRQR